MFPNILLLQKKQHVLKNFNFSDVKNNIFVFYLADKNEIITFALRVQKQSPS